MLPIWKQLLVGHVMDGEISVGCLAESANTDPINQPPSRHPMGQGFCQGIYNSLRSPLDYRQTNQITLDVSLLVGVFIVHLLIAATFR